MYHPAMSSAGPVVNAPNAIIPPATPIPPEASVPPPNHAKVALVAAAPLRLPIAVPVPAVANAIVPLYAPNAVNAPPAKPVPAPIPALATKETCFSMFFNTTVLKSFKFKFPKLPSC